MGWKTTHMRTCLGRTGMSQSQKRQAQGKKFQHEKTKAKRSSSYKGVPSTPAPLQSFKYEDSDQYIVDTVLHCKTLWPPLNNYPSRCKTSSSLEPPPAGATLVHLLLMLLVPQ